MEVSLSRIGIGIKALFAELENSIDDFSFKDQSQRFQLWARNLGLYNKGHSSLDYRFRDAPRIHEFARQLLSDLGDLLRLGL